MSTVLMSSVADLVTESGKLLELFLTNPTSLGNDAEINIVKQYEKEPLSVTITRKYTVMSHSRSNIYF